MEIVLEDKKSEMRVYPFWNKDKIPFSSEISHDFSGKEGEVLFLYPEKGREKRAALLGLGEKEGATVEQLRRSFGGLVREAHKRQIRSITIEIPSSEELSESEVLQGILDALFIANYGFSQLRKQLFHPIEKIALSGLSRNAFKQVDYYQTLYEGVNFARDLVNGDPEDITPEYLADAARKLGAAKILSKKELQKENMGLMLAVSKGAVHDPYLICLEYKGDPKSSDKTVLIGKGVTYDTGGLNLKSSNMETMKSDMSGAAACLAVYKIVKKLKLKINLAVVVPTVENAIGPESFKPGGVYKSHAGISVEVGNTDAEGRLILADAISWAKTNLKPTSIIDIATLTGAMVLALGPEGIGLFSNSETIAENLILAGQKTYERTFRFPLIEEYRQNLKSDIADICNIGGRAGGAIHAAIFLKEFIGNIPWAHLDIAPCAFFPEGRKYYPKYATGVGVRLLVEYLQNTLRP